MMNIAEFLTISSAICPDRTAIVFEGERYSFSRLNERENRLANALKEWGVQKGDRIALIQVNCNQCVETCFAAAKLGAIYLPLNFRAKADELEYMLNFAEANTIFVGSRYLDLVDSIRLKLAAVKNYVSIDNRYTGMYNYEDTLNSSSAGEIQNEVDDDETAILMYTTGTTGKPKGVMLPHKKLFHLRPGECQSA